MCLRVVLVAVLVGVAVAEVAEHRLCDNLSPEALSSCTVTEVRVNPCPRRTVCKLTKGSNSSINFDFTPNFSATKLKTGLFWANAMGDVPFMSLYNADGCDYTSCPVTSGQQQVLNYDLLIGNNLPSGTFEFKWKLWNEENEKQICCFKTTVKLARNKSS